MNRDQAITLANRVVDVLRPDSHMITLAGSIRRNKPFVKDAEIVVQPKPGQQASLLAKLDGMVARGEGSKAIYPDGKTRWGDTYRGIQIGEIKVEVFLADADNWGYILWLRTGPGDANTAVMKHMSHHRWPWRFTGGYGQIVNYPGPDADAVPVSKLKIASEDDLFLLLGVPFTRAQDRDQRAYVNSLLRMTRPTPELLLRYRVDVPKPAQQRPLF